jgi:septal ring factor EnvC (AmiA/AmiB activator)
MGIIKFNKFTVKNSAVRLAAAILCILAAGATYEEIVNDKLKQIDIYSGKITETEQEIMVLRSDISANEKKIDSLNSALLILDEFLKDFEGTTYLSPEEIAVEANMVIFLADEVINLQESFKKKIVNLYKRGKNYELELLLSSKTPNEYFRRNEYLQKFAQTRTRELKELEAKKFLLNEKKKLLQLSTSSQRFYVESKRTEKQVIKSTIEKITLEQKNLNYNLDLKKEKLLTQKRHLNAVQVFLKNFRDNKDKYKGLKQPRINYESDNITNLKGSLNQPVDVNLITNKFGDIINNLTGTNSFNPGIDYSIALGSKVYAIAGGTVTLVGESPFYGKVIIITHGNGYRTVYTCLGEVNVNPGDKIRLNQIIAKTGENPEGQLFHFEIWKDKEPLNPEEWLRF